MASRLNGLTRKLTWNDFRAPQPANPGIMRAEAHPGFSPTGAGTVSVGSGASRVWNLADTLTVNITFDSARSWVLSSVRSMPTADQARLLKHEQGHYEIVALLARDMFIEMMQLKNARMARSADVGTAVTTIFNRYRSVAQPIQDKYDSATETNHGQNTAKQTSWNGYFNTAFTQARTPLMTAPDGATYKVELLTILRNAGMTFP